jgi:PAT family beta-lactamase induction signal transducer AmpG
VTASRKLVLLGSLYLAQGLPYGFFTQALPVLLRKQGLALPLIGLANLLMIPWALKFLWAPILDNVRAPRLGKRRAAIIPLQLACAAVLAGLALAASPSAVWPLCIGVLLVNFCAATQDIATDGLAVEILEASERGLGNGLQVGGYRVGMVIGGGAMLWVFGKAGWTVAFLAMAGALLVTTLPIVLHRERSTPPSDAKAGHALRDAFARPGFGAWVVVLATYKTGEWFAQGMLRTFLTDAGQTIDQLGVMLGIVGFSAGLTGALAGGALTSKLGRRRALILFSILQTLALGSIVIAVLVPTVPVFYAVAVAEHLTSGMATAALFTAMMDFSRPTHAGTDFTVQASIVVIATGAATLTSGVSAHALGYAGHFAVCAALSAVGTACVAMYKPRSPELTFL